MAVRAARPRAEVTSPSLPRNPLSGTRAATRAARLISKDSDTACHCRRAAVIESDGSGAAGAVMHPGALASNVGFGTPSEYLVRIGRARGP